MDTSRKQIDDEALTESSCHPTFGGAGSTPGRVYPGKKMAGQLGGGMVTLKNTEILYVNSEDNILVLKGSVPGKKNTLLKIQPQKY